MANNHNSKLICKYANLIFLEPLNLWPSFAACSSCMKSVLRSSYYEPTVQFVSYKAVELQAKKLNFVPNKTFTSAASCVLRGFSSLWVNQTIAFSNNSARYADVSSIMSAALSRLPDGQLLSQAHSGRLTPETIMMIFEKRKIIMRSFRTFFEMSKNMI